MAFTDALDRRPTAPALPQYGTAEYDSTPQDRLHASMPALLSAIMANDTQEAVDPVLAGQEVMPASMHRFAVAVQFNRHCIVADCSHANPAPYAAHATPAAFQI